MRVLIVILILPLSCQSYDYLANNVDPCYDSNGEALRCQPDFVNAAFGREVVASSTCGTPLSKHCFWSSEEISEVSHVSPRSAHQNFLHRRYRQQPGFLQKPRKRPKASCFVCDSSNASSSYPASSLTDLHNSNSPTCWSSPLIPQPTNSTFLTLSLGRTFQITYISMQFCSTRPDSMAIYKSSDFGKNWTPYQFYSSHCKRMYKREARKEASVIDEQEALCSEDYSSRNEKDPLDKNQEDLRVAFSTLEGRPSAADFDMNDDLQDWQTATDIRIIFNRILPIIHPPGPSMSSFKQRQLRSNSMKRRFVSKKMFHQRRFNSPYNSQAALNPESLFFYSLSDLAIGGRCKCNGHASACLPEKEDKGTLKCQCRHNTEGDECQRCKPFYVDRPWKRATKLEGNQCVACNCNDHSNECNFDIDAFRQSGFVSGGVCVACRHNTEGKNCQVCKEGYYRNSKRNMNHKEACIACRCHPIGSMGSSCDQESGQCRCRVGVVGSFCNRCAPGYHQSRSTLEPCVRTDQNPERSESTDCSSCPKRVSIGKVKNICDRDNVVVAEVLSAETERDWVRYSVRSIKTIKQTPKKNKSKRHFNLRRPRSLFQRRYLRSKSRRFKGRSARVAPAETLWLPRKKNNCRCPQLKSGDTYLLMGNVEGAKRRRRRRMRRGLVMNKDVLAVRLNEEVAKRLRRKLKRAVHSNIC